MDFSGFPTLCCTVEKELPWRILEANAFASVLLGEPPETVVSQGRGLAEWIVPEDFSKAIQMLAEPSAEGTFQAAYRMMSGGQEKWVIDTRLQGKNPAVQTAVLTDISLLIENRAAEALGERLDALGAFSATVAHDFNNVLGAVRMAAEMSAMFKDNPEKVETYAAQITASVDGVQKMIGKLLAFGRKGSPSWSCQKLDDLLVLGADFARNLLDKSGREAPSLEVVAGAEAVRVTVNAVAFQQMLAELVLNAAEWSPSSGTIRLSSGECDLDILRGMRLIGGPFTPGRYAFVTVSDSGPGIAKPDVKRLFEPFFSRREPKAKGTGLGLPVVYGLLRSNGCGIELEDEQGCSWRIIIPPAQEEGV